MSQLTGGAPTKTGAHGLQDFPKELFEHKVAKAGEGEKLAGRPIISYFRDALLRLRRNKVAMVSLAVIITIALSGLVGPFFFPKSAGESYENAQNPDFRDQRPTWGEQLIVIEDGYAPPMDIIKEPFNLEAPLRSGGDLVPPVNLRISGQPTVNGVTVEWEPLEGVSGYQVYRATVASGAAPVAPLPNEETDTTREKPEDVNLENFRNDAAERGLLVATVTNPAQGSYTDAAGLDPSETYVYSVVSTVTDPQTSEERVSEKAEAVRVRVAKSITLSDARAIKSDAEVGEVIRGRSHIFGTDNLGRDVFARTIQGTRIDFFLALLVPTISLLIGLTYGAISGLAGGKLDLVMMRIVEIIDTMPEILLLILLQVVLGKGVTSLIIALCAWSWTSYARILRGEVLRLREIEFVQASRLLGASVLSLIRKHVAPNLLGVIIVLWSAHIPRIITSEAFLSLLGLGVEAPAASWGTVLSDAAQRFQAHPYQFFLPATVMALTLLAFFLLGDALRDAFDPKLRGRE